MPFGITNGVAGFQRSIDDVIAKENIKDTFAFVDNVTICGKTQKEHDENLDKFLEAAKKYNMTFNEEKSILSTDTLTLFGNVISKGTTKPDPERLRPLKELPPPQNIAAQRRVIGMSHFVRCRNLPYSVEDIKRMTSACSVFAELRPRFHRSSGTLIKATQSFERLNIDFKGPLPSSSKNRYMFTIVDEFSRFPFVFPCQDINSSTVIKCLCQLFAIFGMPSYVHSDRGSSLISEELKQFFNGRGTATSRTSRCNPQGNGQCERYNGIVWKAVTLALKLVHLVFHSRRKCYLMLSTQYVLFYLLLQTLRLMSACLLIKGDHQVETLCRHG